MWNQLIQIFATEANMQQAILESIVIGFAKANIINQRVALGVQTQQL